MPIHLFAKQSLFSIGNLVGDPLQIDTATTNLMRPSVARICIAMDLRKKFPNKIWIGHGSGGFCQKVEYEKMPKYCFKCYKQGHDAHDCKIKVNYRNEGEKMDQMYVTWVKK